MVKKKPVRATLMSMNERSCYASASVFLIMLDNRVMLILSHRPPNVSVILIFFVLPLLSVLTITLLSFSFPSDPVPIPRPFGPFYISFSLALHLLLSKLRLYLFTQADTMAQSGNGTAGPSSGPSAGPSVSSGKQSAVSNPQ